MENNNSTIESNIEQPETVAPRPLSCEVKQLQAEAEELGLRIVLKDDSVRPAIELQEPNGNWGRWKIKSQSKLDGYHQDYTNVQRCIKKAQEKKELADLRALVLAAKSHSFDEHVPTLDTQVCLLAVQRFEIDSAPGIICDWEGDDFEVVEHDGAYYRPNDTEFENPVVPGVRQLISKERAFEIFNGSPCERYEYECLKHLLDSIFGGHAESSTVTIDGVTITEPWKNIEEARKAGGGL